jgi:hypothetical protein
MSSASEPLGERYRVVRHGFARRCSPERFEKDRLVGRLRLDELDVAHHEDHVRPIPKRSAGRPVGEETESQVVQRKLDGRKRRKFDSQASRLALETAAELSHHIGCFAFAPNQGPQQGLNFRHPHRLPDQRWPTTERQLCRSSEQHACSRAVDPV